MTAEIEQRLVSHLIAVSRRKIAGRTDEDLVATKPLRSVFAGVLEPIRNVGSALEPSSTKDAPPGTSIGLHFKVRPLAEPSIRVKAHWSVYYAVLPSQELVDLERERNRIQTQSPDPAPVTQLIQPDSDNREPTASESSESDEAEAEDSQALDEVEGQPSRDDSHLVLPRAWRRINVQAPPITNGLNVGPLPIEIGATSLDEATASVRQRAESDKDRWRDREIPPTTKGGEPQRERSSSAATVAPIPDWRLGLTVKATRSSEAGVLDVEVILRNRTEFLPPPGEDAGLREPTVFDAGLEVTLDGCELVPMEFLLASEDYRYDRQMPARGIHCVAEWNAIDQELKTETLPIFQQPLLRTRDELAIDFHSLTADQTLATLSGVAEAMHDYELSWETFLGGDALAALSTDQQRACREDLKAFREESSLFRLGIDQLSNDHKLLRSFQLMNEAFEALSTRPGSQMPTWRLFQIVYICSNLPALAIREKSPSDTSSETQTLRDLLDEAGVLWFPTGGGKTEAYLGLIAVALLYDRLRGKDRGVTAWMRFPLRMLSLQQLERLARLIAVLNGIQASNEDFAGGDPFAIGYFVGGQDIPNKITKDDMYRYETSPGSIEKLRMLRVCPFCQDAVTMRTNRTSWRIEHVCSNSDCFTNTSSTMGPYQGSLPICVVDNEIYRYLPSVLVGTVDKLAVAGHNHNFGQLLNSIDQACPRHGYTATGDCVEASQFSAGCRLKKTETVRYHALADPGPALLLQDEFHLLSAELGTFNGHYEGLIHFLCQPVPAKVLAATATVAAYESQVFQIYLKRARRFPQPGWAAGESFYATSLPAEVRRQFVGIASHVRAIDDVILHLTATYQDELRHLRRDVGLFRQIVEAPDLSDEEAHRTLRLHDLSVAYVGRRSLGGSVSEKLPRAERLMSSDDSHLSSTFLFGERTVEEVGAVLDRIVREADDTGSERLDLLIATNMISHGVDLERIGMMMIAGIPSHYAEYVQASSRCARSHPGVVFTCFNVRDPRELSQYEFFPQLHAHVERLVETVAVNRFASNAPAKTLPGLLAGLLMAHYSPRLYPQGVPRSLDDIRTLKTALGMTAGSFAQCLDPVQLEADVATMIGVDRDWPGVSHAQIALIRDVVAEDFATIMGTLGRSLESRLQDAIHPMTSFRDIDEGVPFGSVQSSSLIEGLAEQ